MPVDSFSINHKTLREGVYLKKSQNQLWFTYDVRLIAPANALCGDLSGAVLHTLEHFFADSIRSNPKFKDFTIYVGPMGCRTGFYFVFSKEFSCEEIQQVVVKVFKQILKIPSFALSNSIEPFSEVIPGATVISCGNPTYFDLEQTQDVIKPILDIFSKDSLPKEYEHEKTL